jgi:nitroimidazol reductase NimA-like FMN-containing flavoprotein (pyridoxamine 5'-phosphate oxidase superfamily)
VWFHYAGGAFRVSITRSVVKYRLLQQAPNVTLVVDDAPTYRTVVVSGRAEVLDDDASLVALRRALRAKYGYDFEQPAATDEEVARELHEEQRVVVEITPEQVLSWAGG